MYFPISALVQQHVIIEAILCTVKWAFGQDIPMQYSLISTV